MKIFSLTQAEAEKRIADKQAKVTLFGLGKMGLPLAAIIADSGFSVTGVDINADLVARINAKESVLPSEPGVDELVDKTVTGGFLRATTDGKLAASGADFIIILIPLLVDEHGRPELDVLGKLLEPIGANMDKGSVLIIETTMPPGITDTFVRETLEKATGYEVGKDIGLVFAPERTYSGRVIADIVERYPKIVGGVDPKSGILASVFYKQFVTQGVIRARDARTAEAIKVFKGVYRDINLAIANELALLADVLGVDIWEVIGIANTEPYSHILKPGAGVGGHCIPVYPHFAMSAARKKGIELKLTSHARELNMKMPGIAARAGIKMLIASDRGSVDAKIVVLGLAYRGGKVKEHRHSPSFGVLEELRGFGFNPIITDPLYSDEELHSLTGCVGIQDWKVAIEDADLIILVTNHSDYEEIPSWLSGRNDVKMPAVMDTRAWLTKLKEQPGIDYKLLGDGQD